MARLADRQAIRSEIAATARTEGLELATLNIRRYPMFPERAGSGLPTPGLKVG